MGDILSIVKSVRTDAGDRHMIYPAEDPRVLRVIRKIIRGLSYYHGLGSPVADDQVWADVLRYQVSPDLLGKMEHHHRERDIIEYSFEGPSHPGVLSSWVLTFFEHATFVGMVTNEVKFQETQTGGAQHL